MKFIQMLFTLLVVVMVAAACSPRSATQAPAEAYPPPEERMPTSPSVLYPDYQDGDRVDWDLYMAMLFNGEVVKVVEAADLKITFTLRDGRSLVTYQPAAGELQNAIQACGEKCKSIEIVTP
jgi:hypothetical protein